MNQGTRNRTPEGYTATGIQMSFADGTERGRSSRVRTALKRSAGRLVAGAAPAAFSAGFHSKFPSTLSSAAASTRSAPARPIRRVNHAEGYHLLVEICHLSEPRSARQPSRGTCFYGVKSFLQQAILSCDFVILACVSVCEFYSH